MSENKIKITIIYDNTCFKKDLVADWGFSCLIEAYGQTILFDTGAKSSILFENMEKLDIQYSEIDMLFISHYHWDHTGGLLDFLRKNSVNVFIPESCLMAGETICPVKKDKVFKISENIYSTGTLNEIEHSLVIKHNDQAILITGCSHPGVSKIMQAGSRIAKIKALIGGLHGFNEFELLKDLELVCPTHCTQFINKIKESYPDKYVKGGAGRIIEI